MAEEILRICSHFVY